MPTTSLYRGTEPRSTAGASKAPVFIDSADDLLTAIPAGSGTTEKKYVDTATAQTLTDKAVIPPRTEYLVDGAIAITPHIAVLTKATAGAYTIAAPTVEGTIIDLVSETSAAHVITGTNLFWAGVTGGPFNKITFTAFPGYQARIIASGGLWMVLAAGVGAPAIGD